MRTSNLKVQNILNTKHMHRHVGYLKPSLTSSIQCALFPPGVLEMLINRQNSSESISSLTSTTSHSSMGSLKEQEAKKKKKKSWVRTHRQSLEFALIRNTVITVLSVTEELVLEHQKIEVCQIRSPRQTLTSNKFREIFCSGL